MASWKKVIVSGSSANLADLQVDSLSSGIVTGNSGNLTTTAKNGSGNILGTTGADNVSISGSFSGSFQGTINADIASASVAARATTLSPEATASIADLATTASFADLAGAIRSGLTASHADRATSASIADVATSARTLNNDLTDGNGIADFTYNGSSAASVTVEADGSTLTVGASGVKVSDAGITATQLATSVAGDGLAGGGGTALSVNVDDASIETNSDTLRVKASGITNAMLAGSIENAKLSNSSVTVGTTEIALGASSTTLAGLTDVVGTKFSGSFSGSFQGDGSSLTGLATTLTIDADSGGTSTVDLQTQTFDIAGTSNEIETSVSGQTVTVGLPSDVTIGQDLTVSRDVTVTRNLTVQGTASFQHTTDLDVADRFIRLASGSNANGDGGIAVIQSGSKNAEAFAYDSAQTRWGITGSFDPSTNTIAPEAFMAAVVEGGSGDNDPTDTIAKLTKKGNLFVADNGDIYIYS